MTVLAPCLMAAAGRPGPDTATCNKRLKPLGMKFENVIKYHGSLLQEKRISQIQKGVFKGCQQQTYQQDLEGQTVRREFTVDGSKTLRHTIQLPRKAFADLKNRRTRHLFALFVAELYGTAFDWLQIVGKTDDPAFHHMDKIFNILYLSLTREKTSMSTVEEGILFECKWEGETVSFDLMPKTTWMAVQFGGAPRKK